MAVPAASLKIKDNGYGYENRQQYWSRFSTNLKDFVAAARSFCIFNTKAMHSSFCLARVNRELAIRKVPTNGTELRSSTKFG